MTGIFDDEEEAVHFTPLEWVVAVGALAVSVILTIYLSLFGDLVITL